MCISSEKNYCPQVDYRLRKFKDILDFVKSLSGPEREKIIDEIQIDNYFEEYDNSEVIKNSD